MKKVIILLAFVAVLGLCGCKQSVDNNVTFGEMSFVLPDNGDWYSAEPTQEEWHDAGDESIKFEGDEFNIIIGKSKDGSREWYDSEALEMAYPPCDFLYIDGYLAEAYMGDESCWVEIEGENGYYSLHANCFNDSETAIEDFKELLESIEFDTQGSCFPLTGGAADFNDNFKSEMGSEHIKDIPFQDRVASVSHEVGEPIYIDLGAEYPDPNRVSIVIWEEYQNDFDMSMIDSLVGREVLAIGELYLHEGSAYLRVENSKGLVVFKEISEL